MERYLKIFEPIATELGLEIITAKKGPHESYELALGWIDSYDSVDLETVSNAARLFAEAIDYDVSLDVSSIGAEREIDSAHYEKNIGQYIYVKLINPAQGMVEVEGELVEVDGASIKVSYRFKHTSKVVEIERENIQLLRTAVKV